MALLNRASGQRLATQFKQLLVNFKPLLTEKSPLMALANEVVFSAIEDLQNTCDIENQSQSIET